MTLKIRPCAKYRYGNTNIMWYVAGEGYNVSYSDVIAELELGNEVIVKKHTTSKYVPSDFDCTASLIESMKTWGVDKVELKDNGDYVVMKLKQC